MQAVINVCAVCTRDFVFPVPAYACVGNEDVKEKKVWERKKMRGHGEWQTIGQR